MTSLTTASDGGLFASSPGEGLVEIDPRDGATVRRFPGVEAAERVIRSRDGRHLAAWQASRFALFDVDLGQVVTRRGCGAARVDAAAFGGGGLLLLCSDHHGVWLDPESSSPAPAPIDLPGALAVGPGDAASLGGGRFVLGSLDGWLRVLDAPAWDVLEAVRVSEHAIVDVEVSPDRRRVVARGEQGEATIWLVGSADLWRLPTGDLRRVSWRDDLRLLGDRAERWSIPPASAPRLQRVGAGVSSLRSSPAGRSIVAGLGDGRVVVWGLDGAAFREVSAFRGVVKDAHLMEDGSRVVAAASVDEGSTLRTVDLTDGRVHEGAIRGGIRRFAILADGSALGLSYGPSGPWSARSVGSRATALGWSDEVLGALAVDGAGRRVAVTTESGLVIGGTLGPRGVERRWTARIEGVGPIALGPSGRVLAVTRSGPRLLEDGGAEGPPLDPISLQPTRAAFSPAGDRVAVGDLSGSVWIWRVEDGRLLARLRAHGARISGLVFSGPEELVSASWDASIRRWDLGPLGATTDELIRGLGEAG